MAWPSFSVSVSHAVVVDVTTVVVAGALVVAVVGGSVSGEKLGLVFLYSVRNLYRIAS